MFSVLLGPRAITSALALKSPMSVITRVKFSTASKVRDTAFLTRKLRSVDKNQFRLSETIAAVAVESGSRQKIIGTWLLGCSGMVFGAVVLGGVTRLTESGLSMVTWKLLGEKLPRTDTDWENEFNRYKEFPEFKMQNSSMTLNEFKRIWWFEYAHRTWGRCIGAFFAVPAAFFWYKNWFSKPMRVRVGAFALLIGAQGLMGWYMVQSGLEKDKFQEPTDVVRVSQYRLAAHLSLAFLLYTGLFWSALDHLLPQLRPSPEALMSLKKTGMGPLRALANSSKGLAFITAISGAFVAGLDAGLVYNSFPKMGDNWIPPEILAFSPKLRNFTENPVTVQFDHRILGTSTVTLITTLWFVARKKALPKRIRLAVNTLACAAWLQVTLGITTLVHYVPVSLAAMHQSGSLVLLSCAIWLAKELKHLKVLIK